MKAEIVGGPLDGLEVDVPVGREWVAIPTEPPGHGRPITFSGTWRRCPVVNGEIIWAEGEDQDHS